MCPRVAFSEHGWGNFTLKAAGANLGHFLRSWRMEDSGEFGRVWGKINILLVKVLASKPPKPITSDEQSSPYLREF